MLTVEADAEQATVVAEGQALLSIRRTNASASDDSWWHGPISGMRLEHDGKQWRWNGEAFEAVADIPPEGLP